MNNVNPSHLVKAKLDASLTSELCAEDYLRSNRPSEQSAINIVEGDPEGLSVRSSLQSENAGELKLAGKKPSTIEAVAPNKYFQQQAP